MISVQDNIYEVDITNYEVRNMFENMVNGWFHKDSANYNDFIKALLQADIDAMNEYMNRFALSPISYFDAAGTESSWNSKYSTAEKNRAWKKRCRLLCSK